jgi:ABC-type sugar transport system ATPase subunit
VHALTGANGAGKSTLMAVLCGTHAHYEGEVTINNQPVTIRSPRDAKQLGIHLVQQEVDVALVPGLSIAENIMLDRLAEPGTPSAGRGFGSWRARRWRSWTWRWTSALHRQLHAGRKTADPAGPRAVAPLPLFDSR